MSSASPEAGLTNAQRHFVQGSLDYRSRLKSTIGAATFLIGGLAFSGGGADIGRTNVEIYQQAITKFPSVSAEVYRSAKTYTRNEQNLLIQAANNQDTNAFLAISMSPAYQNARATVRVYQDIHRDRKSYVSRKEQENGNDIDFQWGRGKADFLIVLGGIALAVLGGKTLSKSKEHSQRAIRKARSRAIRVYPAN